MNSNNKKKTENKDNCLLVVSPGGDHQYESGKGAISAD